MRRKVGLLLLNPEVCRVLSWHRAADAEAADEAEADAETETETPSCSQSEPPALQQRYQDRMDRTGMNTLAVRNRWSVPIQTVTIHS